MLPLPWPLLLEALVLGRLSFVFGYCVWHLLEQRRFDEGRVDSHASLCYSQQFGMTFAKLDHFLKNFALSRTYLRVPLPLLDPIAAF